MYVMTKLKKKKKKNVLLIVSIKLVTQVKDLLPSRDLFDLGIIYKGVVGAYTKEEKPGNGALDRAMLFIMICPPLRLTTALPSGSESV